MKTRIPWLVASLMCAVLSADTARATDGRAQLKKVVAEAKIDVAQAIASAQKAVADGKPVEAGLEWFKTPACYEVGMFVDDKIKVVRVDPSTGKVMGVEDEREGDVEPNERAGRTQALAAAKLTLTAAIEAARKEVGGGQPIGVEMGMEDGKARIAASFAAGEKITRAAVDAVSGKVMAVEDEPVPVAYWLFDDESPGRPPAGLLARETHPGKKPGVWKIAADAGAPTRPNVLTLTTAESGGTFNLAIMEKTSFKDVDLRVRLRPDTGKEDQGGGLIWRCKDENNYYICRMNPLENNFRVYKVVNGERQQLESARFDATAGKWYRLRAVMVGDTIACYLNGERLLAVRDATFKDTGMIGLWTKADASSSFDNLVVNPPPAGVHAEKDGHEAKPKTGAAGKGEGKDADDDD